MDGETRLQIRVYLLIRPAEIHSKTAILTAGVRSQTFREAQRVRQFSASSTYVFESPEEAEHAFAVNGQAIAAAGDRYFSGIT